MVRDAGAKTRKDGDAYLEAAGTAFAPVEPYEDATMVDERLLGVVGTTFDNGQDTGADKKEDGLRVAGIPDAKLRVCGWLAARFHDE